MIRRFRWPLLLVAAGAFLLLLDRLYPLALPERQQLYAQVVTDRHGEPLRAFADPDGVWRYPVTAQQISPAYLEALLGYEDRWFWYHPGINPLALLRATWQNLSSGRVISGGSTLSMQVARLLHPHPKTLTGKLQQLLRTLQLEWHLSKVEILDLYLNIAPFGGTLEGVQAASFSYFTRPADQLTDAEAALLAVLPQAPSRLRPDRYPLRAQAARDKLLRRLQQQAIWPAERVAQAMMEPVYAEQPSMPMAAPLLARRMAKTYPGPRLIQTTLDGVLQAQVSDRLYQYVRRLDPHVSAAALLVENSSGEVRAYAGSADFSSIRRAGHVDMVSAVRSPGSTLKPFLYGMALDAGLIHSESLLSDTPRYGLEYQPGNFSGGFSGPVSAADALRRSLNIPAVNLLEQLGVYQFSARLANAGMPLRFAGQKANPALVLGGAGSSLEQLVMGYRALAGSGQVEALKYRSDQALSAPRFLLSPGAAVMVHRMLQPPVRPGARLSSLKPRAMVWKTGTSYGFRDSWALAVSRDYTLGVWVGRPDGTPLPGYSGRTTAVPLLRQLIALLPDQNAPELPMSVSQAEICWPSGLKRQQDSSCAESRMALLLNGAAPATSPGAIAPIHYSQRLRWWQDVEGFRVRPGCGVPPLTEQVSYRWPLALQSWLTDGQRAAATLPEWRPGCAPSSLGELKPLRIIGISDGSILRPAPGALTLPRLRLQSEGGEGLQRWYLNGHLIASGQPGQVIFWTLQGVGTQQLVVVDEAGQLDRLTFRAER